jgi:predicted DNA-binding transcriptional regulator YafY
MLAVDMETEDLAWQTVLGMGHAIEVLEPLTLRQRVTGSLRRALALYGEPQP